uniref:Leukocyte receptor cluster member 4 n=1 Tax=Mandrillus leucophaeus TaxID=9568 RepID=A0A2K5ZHA6_MANLE
RLGTCHSPPASLWGPKSDLAPCPPPSAQLVSLASEVQDLHLAQRKEMASGFSKGPTLGLLPDVPSLMETLSYSYCYVGIMTGEWACPTALSLRRPECLFLRATYSFLLFFILPVFLDRRREGAWLSCMSVPHPHPPPPSPEKAASLEYDYETIRNIDCYGTDFCVRVRDGMRYWNMTVQWWLCRDYKRDLLLRSAWTMLLSAYWHGLHPGYYLSFLTIPLCLAAEGRLESALRGRLSPGGQKAWDWVHWFLKMRAYDYMCMGFVLLSLTDTLRYWASIYFCIHFLALAALGLGLALGGGSPSRRKAASQPTSLAPEKLREE